MSRFLSGSSSDDDEVKLASSAEEGPSDSDDGPETKTKTSLNLSISLRAEEVPYAFVLQSLTEASNEVDKITKTLEQLSVLERSQLAQSEDGKQLLKTVLGMDSAMQGLQEVCRVCRESNFTLSDGRDVDLRLDFAALKSQSRYKKVYLVSEKGKLASNLAKLSFCLVLGNQDFFLKICGPSDSEKTLTKYRRESSVLRKIKGSVLEEGFLEGTESSRLFHFLCEGPGLFNRSSRSFFFYFPFSTEQKKNDKTKNSFAAGMPKRNGRRGPENYHNLARVRGTPHDVWRYERSADCRS